MRPKERPVWFDARAALIQSAELQNTPAGYRAYVDYLSWLAADDEEQKKLCFDQLMSGWAVDSQEFKESPLKKDSEDPTTTGIEHVTEARVLVWRKNLR